MVKMLIMNKLFFLIGLLSVSLLNAQKITKELGDFTEVKIFSGLDVELIQSDKRKIEISGEKANKVKFKNDGRTLKVLLSFPETLAEGKASVKLYYTNLFVVDANEGATVTGKGFNQNQLQVRSQEGAFINLSIKTKSVTVKSVSGGVIKLSGSSDIQEITTNTGGTFHGFNLKINSVSKVKAGSGAKAEVNSGESLTAKVTFGGSIFYKGNPKYFSDKKVIGGVIEQRN